MDEKRKYTVDILTPWDSQGNQIADSNGIYPTVRGCGGAGYQQGYLLDGKIRSQKGEKKQSMIHLGDITKIHGDQIPVVDVITGGSPCQDLSLAGKREGLDGERSGLFMEQLRIVKEMRRKDEESGRSIEFIRPRYMVWENVPGAFSSNEGKDFQTVLTEIVRIVEPNVPDVPLPQRWAKCGCLYDDMGRWSVAWRLHDAQYWGVPQRRKRIALVADFGGLSAPEILFIRKGMQWDTGESEKEGEETPGTVGKSTKKTSGCLNAWDVQSKHIQSENGVSESLYAGECRYGGGESYVMQTKPNNGIVYGISSYESNSMKSNNPNSGIYEADTARTLDNNGGNPACNQGGMMVLDSTISFQERAGKPGGGKGILIQEDRTGALSTFNIQSVLQQKMYTIGHNVGYSQLSDDGITDPLTASDYKEPIKLVVPGCDDKNHDAVRIDLYNQSVTGNVSKTPTNKRTDSDHVPCVTTYESVIRRLTPLECERLQGFPDGWTDIGDWIDSKGKSHSTTDTARYKAIGNSIALPFWQYLARRMCAQYERDITMGSLFDGIGGFPLVFKRCGATPVWASEIEDFCIAVTKKHFGGKDGNESVQ